MTSLGGVLFAFYYNNLLPSRFSTSPHHRADLGPIGGIGTRSAPSSGLSCWIAGRDAGEIMRAFGTISRRQEVFYGFCSLVVVPPDTRRR